MTIGRPINRTDFPSNSTLIVVDLQNDFITGTLAVPNAERAALKCIQYAQMFKENGDPVVWTMDFHKKDHPSFKEQGGPWPEHCVINTWGQDLYPPVYSNVPGEITKVLKGYDKECYSGFESRDTLKSPLELFLYYGHTSNVFICGLATDYCVKATALDSAKLGFRTFVLTDACAGVAPDSTEKAYTELMANGVNLIK